MTKKPTNTDEFDLTAKQLAEIEHELASIDAAEDEQRQQLKQLEEKAQFVEDVLATAPGKRKFRGDVGRLQGELDNLARAAQMAAAERLKQARVAAGFPSAMGAAKYFEWKTSTYASHENGSAALRPFWAELYGQAFRVSPRWILSGIDEPGVMPGKTQMRMNSLARSPTTNVNPTPAPKSTVLNRVGTISTLTVYGWSRTDNNEIVTNFSRINEAVSTPGNLMGVEEAYAALIADKSMSPRVRPGDTVLVNPTKPPRISDLVIATDGKIGYLREYAGEENGPYESYPAAFVKDAEGNQMKLPLGSWQFHRVVGVYFD